MVRGWTALWVVANLGNIVPQMVCVWTAIDPGGRKLGTSSLTLDASNGTRLDCLLGGREFGEYGASNGMGLNCLPGGLELGTLDASNGMRLDCPLGGREFGEYCASNGMGLDCLLGGLDTHNDYFFKIIFILLKSAACRQCRSSFLPATPQTFF